MSHKLCTFTAEELMKPVKAERKATEQTAKEWIENYTNTRLTCNQLDYIHKWVYELQLYFLDIVKACSISVENIDRIDFLYVNELLEKTAAKERERLWEELM